MRKKSGFTLVELLMVMGILGILMTVLFQVFNSILAMKLRSEATTSVAQDSRYLISRLTYDISRASDITSGTGGTLSLIIDGTTYFYALENTTLMLSIAGAPAQALTGVQTKIASLQFTRFGDVAGKKIVEITLRLAPVTILREGATGERLLTTTVATR